MYQSGEVFLGWMSSITTRAQFIDSHDGFPFLQPRRLNLV
jgi:hypothetical protein